MVGGKKGRVVERKGEMRNCRHKEEVKEVVETRIISIYIVLLYIVSFRIYIIDSVVEAVEGKLHLLEGRLTSCFSLLSVKENGWT